MKRLLLLFVYFLVFSGVGLVHSGKKMTILPNLVASVIEEGTGSSTITAEGFATETRFPPQFSEERGVLGHIFRDSPGHFRTDSQENRALILKAVSRHGNRVGIDNHGKEIYLKALSDGTQVWAHVRDGVIKNAGCNQIPMRWVVDSSAREGGSMVPLFNNVRLLDAEDFIERIQFNRLIPDYDSRQTEPLTSSHLISSSRPEQKKELQGVEHRTGLILNLLEELKGAGHINENSFFIPIQDRECFLEEGEVRQILRELARGIYLYNTLPYISIHFNQDLTLYPIIHPVYQNTLIGHMIAMLDYYMKGFCHGQFFEGQFVQQWNQNPVLDEKFLREKCIDFKAYCEQHLGESFQTFDEIFSSLEKQLPPASDDLRIRRQNFDIAYRIIGKQNSIRRAQNLFVLDGDFDVEYSIDHVFTSEAQKQVCEKACDLMTKQIKELLPRIPAVKKLFTSLCLTNFFAYYFNTLKEADKIPYFSREFLTEAKQVCPYFFPPLPKLAGNKLNFRPLEIIQLMTQEKTAQLIDCLQRKDQGLSVVDHLTEALKQYVQQQTTINLPEETYQSLGTTLLEACKRRYEMTRRAVETTMIAMGIKTPDEQLNENEVGIRMDRLIQRLDQDIAETLKVIESKKRKGRSYDEELQWVSDWEEGKQEVIQQKPRLQKWFRDPLTTILEGAALSLNLSTRVLTVTKDDSSGKIAVAGGLGLRIHNQVAQEDAYGDVLLKRYWSDFFSLPYEELLKIEDGMFFKLPFGELVPIAEEFGPVKMNRVQAAVWHLMPPQPDYPVNEEVLNLFHAITTEDCDLFVKTAGHIHDWNFQDALGSKLIHYAASAKNSLFLQAVMSRGANPLAVDSQGFTALHCAAKDGNLVNIQLLLDAVPQLLNAKSFNGETSLHLAVRYGQIESVRFLIQAGADPNITTQFGGNALLSALRRGGEESALELLSARSLNVEHRLLDGTAAIHLAIEMQLAKALQRLLEVGADGNQLLRSGHRPIHLAVMQGWLEGVKILAEAPGIILDAPSRSGQTPLEIAMMQNHKEITAFLRGK